MSAGTELAGARGHRGRGYTLITPGNHYVSRLPGLPGVEFVKLVTPRLAPARFGQYLVRSPGGSATIALEADLEHFLFGLGGVCELADAERRSDVSADGFAYVPPGEAFVLRISHGAALLWLKRHWQPWPGMELPQARRGSVRALAATPTATAGLTRRELLPPDDAAFDFNMSLLSFEPNVGLPQIEIHDEEHGLWMTRGGGSYRLGADEHPVHAEDFIYMAPYCPQGFAAGPDGAEYLLYKDVYRDGF